MLTWILLGLPVLLAWSLVDPLRAVRRGPVRVVVAVVSGVVLVSVYHQLLRWDIYGMTFRALLLPLFAGIVVLSAWRLRQERGQGACRWARAWLWMAGAAGIVAGAWLLVVPRHPEEAVGRLELGWPLAPGRYVVIQGGEAPYNHHAAVAAQRYALDITAVTGVTGRRADGLMPSDLAAYRIYGTEVLAPCDGTVVLTQDGRAETPVGQGVTGDVAGNMVALHCDPATVVVAHLQDGVAVTEGQAVTRGTVLGRVGSTGNSTEPHLHIHAVAGRQADPDCLLFTCASLPIRLDGRDLARNDMFEVPDE